MSVSLFVSYSHSSGGSDFGFGFVVLPRCQSAPKSYEDIEEITEKIKDSQEHKEIAVLNWIVLDDT